MRRIIEGIAYGLGLLIVTLGVIAIPFVVWGLIMMALTWPVSWIYNHGLQQIIDGPDVGYWPMFFTLWLTAIIAGMFGRSS